MGMYPSADLLYGIDLGLEDEMERPDWFTEELEEEHGSMAEALDHLLRSVGGVGYHTYGNFLSGYTGLALCTQSVGVRAYEAKRVGVNQLTGMAEDDKALEAAWAVLYPGQIMPEPGWFIVLSLG